MKDEISILKWQLKFIMSFWTWSTFEPLLISLCIENFLFVLMNPIETAEQHKRLIFMK